MRVHYLQHVHFEGLGSMESDIRAKGYRLSSTMLFKDRLLPDLRDIDCLIVLGGPMGARDEADYPWLVREKLFIRQAIDSGKAVLGICLGAQLIADVMGAEVYRNKYREIGWFDIRRSSGLDNTFLDGTIPLKMKVFHWHGDTFDIPEGAEPIAESDACENQGFIFRDHVLALQFHLETTVESATALIQNCRHELDGSLYVQSEKEILSNKVWFSDINLAMSSLLDVFLKKWQAGDCQNL